MDKKELLEFCDKWIKIFSDKIGDINWDRESPICDIEAFDDFQDFMEKNNIKFDLLESWGKLYPKADRSDKAKFMEPIPKITDIKFLLVAIFSEWRLATYHEVDYHPEWFVAALKQLKKLASA